MSSHHVPVTTSPQESPDWTDASIDAGGGERRAVRLYGRRVGGRQALVVHFHGGAFVAGSLDSGVVVARLLAAAGAVVVSVDYPRAPAHPFPAALDAGYAALVWAHRTRTRLAGGRARLFVAGEEAGANLAAAMALVARDRRYPSLAGQVLFSPMLDPCMATASLRETQAGPVGCKWADGWCRYLDAPASAEHPYAVPGRAVRLADLAPALLLTAEDDPMRDEAHAYALRLRQAGRQASEIVLPPPSGWPDALLVPPVGAAAADESLSRAARPVRLDGDSPAWAAALRPRLRDFFDGTPG